MRRASGDAAVDVAPVQDAGPRGALEAVQRSKREESTDLFAVAGGFILLAATAALHRADGSHQIATSAVLLNSRKPRYPPAEASTSI